MDDLIKRDSALKGYDTVLSILDSAINAVSETKAIVLQYGSEPEQRWIPCSERLPEKANFYISTMKDGHVTFVWYSTFHGFERQEEVVAWMPLPEPYGERKDDEQIR